LNILIKIGFSQLDLLAITLDFAFNLIGKICSEILLHGRLKFLIIQLFGVAFEVLQALPGVFIKVFQVIVDQGFSQDLFPETWREM